MASQQRLRQDAGEAGVLGAMRAAGVKPGSYCFPRAATHKDIALPEDAGEVQGGAGGIQTVIPSGAPAMGKPLVLWFVYSLIVGVCVAISSAGRCRWRRPISPYSGWPQSFLAYGFAHISNSIWMGQPWRVAAKNLLDALIYGCVTGGAFGWSGCRGEIEVEPRRRKGRIAVSPLSICASSCAGSPNRADRIAVSGVHLARKMMIATADFGHRPSGWTPWWIRWRTPGSRCGTDASRSCASAAVTSAPPCSPCSRLVPAMSAPGDATLAAALSAPLSSAILGSLFVDGGGIGTFVHSASTANTDRGSRLQKQIETNEKRVLFAFFCSIVDRHR